MPPTSPALSAKLIFPTKEIVEEYYLPIIYTACRTCYSELVPERIWDKAVSREVADEKQQSLVRKVMESGHGSTIEHVNFTFAISGVTRTLSHQLVRHRAIFAGLPTPRIEAAARRLVPVPIERGRVVIREGEPADRFYLVADGSLRVTQGDAAVHLRDLGAGDVFGEIGLLRHSPRTATVTATSDGSLMALNADGFAELVGAGPVLSSRLLDLYRGALTR